MASLRRLFLQSSGLRCRLGMYSLSSLVSKRRKANLDDPRGEIVARDTLTVGTRSREKCGGVHTGAALGV